MIFDWNKEKNKKLEEDRGISFEDVLLIIEEGKYTIINHENTEKYPSQKIYIIPFQDYIYMIPFVDNEETRFLKTIIPSRKMNKKYDYLKK